jgi:hypothetical protein
MRSIIAALRSLVLPFGATTGRRIVLDGVAGTISIYDAANVLRIRLGFSADDLELWSGQASESLGGDLQAYPVGSAGSAARRVGMVLESGSFAGKSKGSIDVNSESFDGTIAPVITYNAKNHNFAAPSGEALLAISGYRLGGVYSSPSTLPPATFLGIVIFETDTGSFLAWDGSRFWQINATMQDPTWRAEATADVALSTTAGTYTDLLTLSNLALKQGRMYKITAKPGAYLISTGSAFAVTDTWRFRVYRDVGSGYANMRANKAVRSNVAASAVIPAADFHGLFSPAASGNVSFKLQASKTAGAATVISTVSVDGGEGYIELLVEDIGEASAALH